MERPLCPKCNIKCNYYGDYDTIFKCPICNELRTKRIWRKMEEK